MSEVITTFVEGSDVVQEPERIDECVCQSTVLVPVQAVTFSTAAAVALPRTSLLTTWGAALRSVLHRSPADDGPLVPRHYPPRRTEFLESAAMAREMYRL